MDRDRSEIIEINIDRDSSRKIVQLPSGRVSYPAFSPDGRKVYFSWQRSTNDSFGIFGIENGSANPLQLTKSNLHTNDFYPQPFDGGLCFVEKDHDGIAQIKKLILSTNREMKITDRNFLYMYQPSVSSDAKRIVVECQPLHSSESRASRCFLISMESGQTEELMPNFPGAEKNNVLLSAPCFVSSTKCLFIACSGELDWLGHYVYEIFSYDLCSKHIAQITKLNGALNCLRVSPDGTLATFILQGPFSSNARIVMKSDGSEMRVLHTRLPH